MPANVWSPVARRYRRLGSPATACHVPTVTTDSACQRQILSSRFYLGAGKFGRRGPGRQGTMTVRPCGRGGPMVTLEQDLVRSAANARDVIESYRRSHVAISGWSTLLQEVLETFTRISAQRPVVGESVALAQLARALQDTADARLQVDRGTLDQLSRALRSIVTAIRIPGIPRREDEDWAF